MNLLLFFRNSGLIGASLFLLAFAFMGFLLYRRQGIRFKKRDRTFKLYQNSLSKLRSNPNDADLRERTITLGRAYSNLTRNKNGDIAFDEIALMNEVKAACGNVIPKQFTAPNNSVESRLQQLEDLRFKQLITESEYHSRRQQILDEL